MGNVRMLGTVFISALLLQSCTVIQWELRNELKGNPSSPYPFGQPCTVNYFISYGYIGYYQGQALSWPEKRHFRTFIKTTKAIISKLGCSANYVEHEEGANLKIRIGAFPYDDGGLLLTGLSFGLIPTWGTSQAYAYDFENVSTNKSHRYLVDATHYNHLIVSPFTLLQLLLDVTGVYSEVSLYEKALINFIENS